MPNNKKKSVSPGASRTRSRSLKFRFIAIASHKPEQWDSLITIARSHYDWFAYIIHQPESEESHEHLHLLCLSGSPLLLDKHWTHFGDLIPKNMIEGIISGRAFCRYLTHKDSPDKIQYKDEDVVSSDMNKYYALINEKIYLDSTELWKDYKSLRVGSLTPDEFIEKYSREMASMPFYQKFSMLHKIFDQCSYTFINSHASLSFESGSAHPPGSIKNDSTSLRCEGEDHVINKSNRKDTHDSKTN